MNVTKHGDVATPQALWKGTEKKGYQQVKKDKIRLIFEGETKHDNKENNHLSQQGNPTAADASEKQDQEATPNAAAINKKKLTVPKGLTKQKAAAEVSAPPLNARKLLEVQSASLT